MASAVWEIPYGKGRRYGGQGAGPAEWLLCSWEFSPIVTVQSGLGLTITQSQLLNLGGERRNRPNRIRNGALSRGERNVDRWFDTGAFVILQTAPTVAGFVANQAFGNSGVGVLRGPGLGNVDFNLSKTFSVTERHSVQFRAEFFNTFNRANFSVPGINAAGGFAQIVATSTEARIIQFALKYRF